MAATVWCLAEEKSAVEVDLVSAEPTLRSPKSRWTFDIRLANRAAVTRWFLIPDPPEKGLELRRAAHAIDVVRLGGRVAMLRIRATHGLVALHLAPEAEVALAGLELTSWDEQPIQALEIWATRELLLDGEPLGPEHLGEEGVLVAGATAVSAVTEEIVHAWSDPDLADHPLRYAADETWSLAVHGAAPWRPNPGGSGGVRPPAGDRAPASRWRGERISASFKDADLRDVLRSFAELRGFNLVLHPEVRGTVTLELRDVPWDQALWVILKSHGLAAELGDGRMWTISPR